jgi:hypothetical protein
MVAVIILAFVPETKTATKPDGFGAPNELEAHPQG